MKYRQGTQNRFPEIELVEMGFLEAQVSKIKDPS